jgi:hypothetical protein
MKLPIAALLSLLVAGAALAAPPELRINAQVDKANAVLSLDDGDVCDINLDKKREGICGTTTEFKGKKQQVWAGFSDSVTKAMIAPLRAKGGESIVGTVQCKRVRMGTLPDIPEMPAMVIAEECTIKSLKNK